MNLRPSGYETDDTVKHSYCGGTQCQSSAVFPYSRVTQLPCLHTVTRESWHPNGTQIRALEKLGAKKNGLGAKLHADLVTISHQEIAPSPQLGVEHGLAKSDRHLCGIATT